MTGVVILVIIILISVVAIVGGVFIYKKHQTIVAPPVPTVNISNQAPVPISNQSSIIVDTGIPSHSNIDIIDLIIKNIGVTWGGSVGRDDVYITFDEITKTTMKLTMKLPSKNLIFSVDDLKWILNNNGSITINSSKLNLTTNPAGNEVPWTIYGVDATHIGITYKVFTDLYVIYTKQ